MSVVWLSVFCLLCVELIVTAVLVLPLPRVVRKSIASAIFRFELAKRVRFFINFTILACLFAIWDCVQELTRLREKYEAPSSPDKVGMNIEGGDSQASYFQSSLDRQRRFRSERNLYLSAFTLTLLFVIGRLLDMSRDEIIADKRLEELNRLINGEPTVAPVKAAGASGASPAKRKPVVPVVPVSAADRKKM